jgi:hypothetical protein
VDADAAAIEAAVVDGDLDSETAAAPFLLSERVGYALFRFFFDVFLLSSATFACDC